jgi:hypothetical protein
MARPPSSRQGKKANASSSTGRSGRLTEDIFLGVVIVACFAASVVLALPFKAPPAMIATLLAVAVSTLVYRFLGGIPADTRIFVKSVQIGGSLAALMALYMLFNTHLEKQYRLDVTFRPDEVEGTWQQIYPEKNWRGEYSFYRDPALPDNELRASGTLNRVSQGETVPLYELLEGSRVVITAHGIVLKFHLRNIESKAPSFGQEMTWETAPMKRQRSASGQANVRYISPAGSPDRIQHWGIGLSRID